MKRFLVLVGGLITLAGCYYDKEDQLYPKPAVAPGCDTTNIHFAADILPILNSKCGTTDCHDAVTKKGGYNLTGYSGAKLAVEDNKLLRSIRWEPNAKPMPEGLPKLDECSINKISRWVNQGYQND